MEENSGTSVTELICFEKIQCILFFLLTTEHTDFKDVSAPEHTRLSILLKGNKTQRILFDVAMQ